MSETMTTAFNPAFWAASWNYNAAVAERNSLQDSGWSARVAADCDSTARRLAHELLAAMREISVIPTDFFDRPVLAAVLSAAHRTAPALAAAKGTR